MIITGLRVISSIGLALTDHDMEHLCTTYKQRLDDHDLPDDHDDHDDGTGDEVVMTSQGYVDLWFDGQVMSHGQLVAQLTNEGGE